MIFRYISKEILTTLCALTTLLLLIFLSNQFVHYVGRAANGSFPGLVIVKLMMLEIPNLLGLILPLGFYVATLLALSRLYVDREIIALHASGFSYASLVKTVLLLAVFLSAITALLLLFLAPNVSKLRTTLIRQGGINVLVKTLAPKQFRLINGGEKVIYVEGINQGHSKAKNVFIARRLDKAKQGFEIMRAKQAALREDADGGMINLSDGAIYQGTPGTGAFKVTRFADYFYQIPPLNIDVKDDVRTLPSKTLLYAASTDLRLKTELIWRSSIPIMVIVLALLAIPLAKVDPRQGKFALLIPAILLYVFYANFMFIGRDWLLSGKTPLWLGLWWLHGTFFVLALLLIWFRQVRQK